MPELKLVELEWKLLNGDISMVIGIIGGKLQREVHACGSNWERV